MTFLEYSHEEHINDHGFSEYTHNLTVVKDAYYGTSTLIHKPLET